MAPGAAALPASCTFINKQPVKPHMKPSGGFPPDGRYTIDASGVRYAPPPFTIQKR